MNIKDEAVSMREKIAKAIYEQRNGAGAVPWSRRDNAHKGPYLDDADAALHALTQPDEAMIRDGASAMDHPSVFMGGPSHHSLKNAPRIFTAMIQAAKEGG